MKFYVVGFDSGKVVGKKIPVAFGDALVWADSGREALTKVRGIGLVPNPGDVYLLGTESQKSYQGYPDEELTEELKGEAERKGVAIIWTSWP